MTKLGDLENIERLAIELSEYIYGYQFHGGLGRTIAAEIRALRKTIAKERTLVFNKLHEEQTSRGA